MYIDTKEKIINKKEYLGRNDLIEVVIPSSVEMIENWAFAQCKNLSRVALSTNVSFMGKDIFMDCTSLKQIHVYKAGQPDEDRIFEVVDEKEESLSEMSAIAFTIFDEPELKNIAEVGEKSWLHKWDEACTNYVNREDGYGFSPFLAGGEEDYVDKENNYEYYCHIIRLKKIKLILMRMLSEKHYSLEEKTKESFVRYLKEHMESSNFSEVDFGETCEVLIESRYETDKYYKIYEENKLINSDNIEEIIKYTPDDNIELKALLLRFRNNMPKQNIWNVFDI